jgi:hypothetical protein
VNPYHDARGRFTSKGGAAGGRKGKLSERIGQKKKPDVPKGWDRYYSAMMDTPDRTHDSGVRMLPTDSVWHYREYDRGSDSPNTVALKRAVMDSGGKIKTPITLRMNSYGGMVSEGNHRLQVARELGIDVVPVRIVDSGLIKPSDVGSRGVSRHKSKRPL